MALTRAQAEQAHIEAEKMRRVPGIVFADGPAGRRARIAGTGIEVFEVIDVYLVRGKSIERLKAWFDWLTDEQLRAAVTYYELYPDEIHARLELEWAADPSYAGEKP